jgi:hypothetical protein
MVQEQINTFHIIALPSSTLTSRQLGIRITHANSGVRPGDDHIQLIVDRMRRMYKGDCDNAPVNEPATRTIGNKKKKKD